MAETLDKETLKALSTDTRQEIIKMLSRRPYTASEISKIMNKHVTTITEHLDILEKSGLIQRKDSTNKWIYYALTDKGQKIFKPAYYTWVITLSLAAIIIVAFSLFYTFGTNNRSFGASSPITSQSEYAANQPLSVGVGEVVQESGQNYVPVTVTDQNNMPVAVEVNGKITDSGTVPVYIEDAAENISIQVRETRTIDKRSVVPLDIHTTKTAVSINTNATEKTINVKIIDSEGNVNTFPLKMRVKK